MDFTPMRISTVKPQKSLTFDLFINLENQYLCYIKKGELIPAEKYIKLRAQKIAKFFILESDESTYQNFLDTMLNETVIDLKTNIDEKIIMVEGAACSAIERMQKNPESESAFRVTVSAAKNMRKILKQNPEAFKKIFGKKSDQSEEIIKHSVNVCALALKLAEKLNHTDAELDDLGTAALIHDIGLVQMSRDSQGLFLKPSRELNARERSEYSQHVYLPSTLLQRKKYMNKTIYDLVINHEEVLSGQGPNKKKKLTKLEEILSLVDNYEKRVSTCHVSAAEAFKELMIDELGNYSLNLLNEFKKILRDEAVI